MKKSGLLLIVSLSMFLATQSHGLGLGMLDFLPAKHFTEKDWAMAKVSAGKALKQGKEGEVYTWLNEATNHKGAYKILHTLKVDGRDCRDLYIRHITRTYKGSGSYRFCKMDSGEWKTTGRTPDE
ncbi:MAG: hypothetical protein ABW092_19225 [Candidatus Thiodiazotropha sp.]